METELPLRNHVEDAGPLQPYATDMMVSPWGCHSSANRRAHYRHNRPGGSQSHRCLGSPPPKAVDHPHGRDPSALSCGAAVEPSLSVVLRAISEVFVRDGGDRDCGFRAWPRAWGQSRCRGQLSICTAVWAQACAAMKFQRGCRCAA